MQLVVMSSVIVPNSDAPAGIFVCCIQSSQGQAVLQNTGKGGSSCQ
jgi:hypothetical protein